MPKPILTIFSIIGIITVILGLLGAVGIGDFVYFYGGSAEQWCSQQFQLQK